MILTCFPRIHLGLMDVGHATSRRFGGAGFTLTRPLTEVSAVPSTRLIVNGLDKLDSAAKGDVIGAVDRLRKLKPTLTAAVTINSCPPQHVGLGSKSSLLLGVLAAIGFANSQPFAKSTLQKLSGRGGASGIGINSFFTGGFLTDVGHPATAETETPFFPSSRKAPREIPSVSSRASIPKEWVFHLVLPNGRRFSSTKEVNFFRSNTPIRKSEVFKSIGTLYHGVVPAVITKDLKLLRQSIAQLHKFGFKKLELENQSENVRLIFNRLSKIENCAVGLSSMGPLIYVIGNVFDTELRVQIGVICAKYDATLLDSCSGRNRGFEVEE